MEKRYQSKTVIISIVAIVGLVSGTALFLSMFFGKNELAMRRSTFKIIVSSQTPNFRQPWKYDADRRSYGSGFYIGDKRIMTNAHVVANGRMIEVLRDGDTKPTTAYVEFIAHDSDLAILRCNDKSFFDGVKPLKFGKVPKLESPVSTIGYPMGGDQISITEGVVSRISFRTYAHSGFRQHLLVQVDSAINPGNSGGPVIQNGKVVGVAFQSFTAAENTGYIIPVPVIRRFLTDIKDGNYAGHPDDGLVTQTDVLSNPSAAKFHGLASSEYGVRVAFVAPYSASFGVIKENDVLLEVDSLLIGADGRIFFEGERIDFNAVYDLKQIGDIVKFKVMREGKLLDLSFTAKADLPHYYAGDIYAKYPKFFVWGGLVFSALSRSYLQTFGQNWYTTAPNLLRYLHSYAELDEEFRGNEEIIVLIDLLPHPVNTYSQSFKNQVLTRFNDQPIRSMAEFIELAGSVKDEQVLLGFSGKNNILALDLKKTAAASAEINKSYEVDPPQWIAGTEVDGAVSLQSEKP